MLSCQEHTIQSEDKLNNKLPFLLTSTESRRFNPDVLNLIDQFIATHNNNKYDYVILIYNIDPFVTAIAFTSVSPKFSPKDTPYHYFLHNGRKVYVFSGIDEIYCKSDSCGNIFGKKYSILDQWYMIIKTIDNSKHIEIDTSGSSIPFTNKGLGLKSIIDYHPPTCP
jgi:hypothetical protein